MSWFDKTLDSLAKRPCCGYRAGGAAAVEPTALAAMALVAGRREQAAGQALEWLAHLQTDEGSLGIDADNSRPRWTTGWAVLAWRAAPALARVSHHRMPLLGPRQAVLEHGGDTASCEAVAHRCGPSSSSETCGLAEDPPWTAAADKAVAWILSLRGLSLPQSPTSQHDSTLCGWPWVESTHSWVEPTAISLLALKMSGEAGHARSREAVRLLLDRMLPSGGWNYGNTVIFGSTLRPQAQPTGLALAALGGEPSAAEHVRRSIDYLDRVLCEQTTTASLCYALIGAAAHGYRPAAAQQWLEAAWRRTLARGASPYLLALTALAHLGEHCPWYADALDADTLAGQQR